MKKLILLLALMILSIAANAMKIVTNEKDEFTGSRTVITSWESFDKTQIHIRFHLQEGLITLDLKFRNGSAIVIPEGGKLMFKSGDDEIETLESIALYSGGLGDGAVGLNGSGVWGISARYSGNVEWFKAHAAKLLRIYTTTEYYDKKLSEKEAKKLQQLANLFIGAITE